MLLTHPLSDNLKARDASASKKDDVAQPTVMPAEIAKDGKSKAVDVQNSQQIQEKVPSGNNGTFVQSDSLQACPDEDPAQQNICFFFVVQFYSVGYRLLAEFHSIR